jgi:hypothetical protein
MGTKYLLAKPFSCLISFDDIQVEWQDRRRTIQMNLEALQQKRDYHIANLDAALTIIAKVGILYNKLERSDQKDLLRQMVERVVVNPERIIIRLELLPPFSYLRHVTERVQNSGGSAVEGKQRPAQWLVNVRTTPYLVTVTRLKMNRPPSHLPLISWNTLNSLAILSA